MSTDEHHTKRDAREKIINDAICAKLGCHVGEVRDAGKGTSTNGKLLSSKNK